ncbi:MAG TPA: Rne/Rng family ribonuclease [Gaiellaceae bacterium]|nr:Rne/Rng family ribonuclease [Gaiellaceae bacterium]
MLRWFRRKPTERSAPADEQATPTSTVETPAAQAADTTTPTSTAARRRRRGSRGGRGRRKPGERAEQKAEKPEKAEAKAKPERKPRESRPRQTRRRTATPRALPPPAKRDLVVSVDVAEQRVAILEDDKVAEVYLERPESRSIAGNIYKGSVDNVLPGMEAAFVEIGLEKNGFLYVDEIVTPELEGRRHGRKIQDLLSRGEEILVQAVKDPMKSKGARLTTEISLPGRFVVYVPSGEGFGVSRRLPEEERARLRDILKSVAPKKGSMIVRTAAEGASAEDIERDIDFLQRLWKEIQKRAEQAKSPALVYQEAELPLRVVRDLFTNDFEQAVVDHDLTYKRIVGYLKKTSPHMAEKVRKHSGKTSLFEEFGVEEEIRSTLSRRVDLPSGGYLVFDYAEAFTVIDVNTGRFVGSRSKSSASRLEDTITKNNLEAVKEVVRQLRLRDIGGIIVIDFIDMANPKNRAAVEEALKTELERDRTKTYVVEISPLGLVEMTRQNVSHGPREILTKRCPTCAGDGIVFSEISAAVEGERKLRSLAAGSRTTAYRVELNPHVASILIGPGAARLQAIEERTRRRFFIEAREGAPPEHFEVVARGPLAKLQPEAPVAEGQELDVKPVEVGLHDPSAGVAKHDGLDVVVADGGSLVGKRVKVRVNRVLDGTAYAEPVGRPEAAAPPITAEALAEKPTRARRSRIAKPEEPKAEAAEAVAEEPEAVEEVGEPEEAAEPEEAEAEEAPRPKKRTRRGSRGGRRRKKKPAEATVEDGAAAVEETEKNGKPEAPVLIHLPDRTLGEEEEPEPAEAPAEEAPAGEAPKPKKRTRRGSRGGRRRRKPAAKSNGATAGGNTQPKAEKAEKPLVD